MARTNGQLTGNRCKCAACGERHLPLGRNPEDLDMRIVNTKTGSVWKMKPNEKFLSRFVS